jgi:histidinol-phosphate aminotransferase
MALFDRRDWLRLMGLAIGGTVASPRLFAESARTAAWVSPASEKGLVRLSLNENPYGPAPSVLKAVQREFANFCRYTGVEVGHLLASISTKEAISEEHIILGEILEPLGTYLSLQGGSGGEFIYSDPGYTALIDAAAAVGGVGIPVPLERPDAE